MRHIMSVLCGAAVLTMAGAASADTFNPQPDPPGKAKVKAMAKVKLNPQPEPPGVQAAKTKAVHKLKPGETKALNPQPEPPGL